MRERERERRGGNRAGIGQAIQSNIVCMYVCRVYQRLRVRGVLVVVYDE